MNCRHCSNQLQHTFLDLGFAPPSNALLKAESLKRPETYFPLHLFVCEKCWLVQTEDYATSAELFDSEYVYFSSISTSWLEHATNYSEMITKRLNLSRHSMVIEVASNDGYLLKNFIANEIPCLGIEPTKSTADAAEKIGIPVVREFFGQTTADRLVQDYGQADLVIGNNVFAHVPDINDFTLGIQRILKPQGSVTLEFPHLLQLIEQSQFDTVYHEHYSYLSLRTVISIFERANLKVYDVERLSTHGGSLRVYGCHQDSAHEVTENIASVLHDESTHGLKDLSTYETFQEKANKIKNGIIEFLIDAKKAGKVVLGYGAAAKGCTLLNYAGVKPDLLPVIFDAAPSKQGKFLPGCHIPIHNPSELISNKPDYILILPWNIKDEVMKQLAGNLPEKTRFVVAVPSLTII